MTMIVASSQRSDTGRVRERNEDYVWVDEQAGVFIVADGLGGHQAGDVASRLAATTVGETVAAGIGSANERFSTAAVRELMTDAIETANGKVRAAASKAGQELHMGTVIVVALVRPPVAYISHAGDARAYLARDSTLTRLTEDDSVVAQLVAAGELSAAEARNHPQRNLVTKVVGQDSPVQPSFSEVAVEPGDWLVLCSDGLWDMVDDEAILEELQKADEHAARATQALIRAANAAGGTDNISVIAIRVLPVGNEGGP
jgi:serine/threonine protein phosphatase PrpC